MGNKQIMSNMKMILTDSDLKRVKCNKLDDDRTYIVIDLHGLTKRQAERLVKNIICINRGELVINVIHGYRHGTVLKQMVSQADLSHRLAERYSPTKNPGQTYLTIAA